MDISKLKTVLVDGKKQFSFITPKNGDVSLVDAESKMSVGLTGMPEESFVIKAPASQSAYLARDYNLICDYFVVVPRGNDADVILCEMKTTIGVREHRYACKQIKCSIPLLYYIKAALKVHFNKDGKTNIHYAIIAKNAKKNANMASINTTHGGGHDNYDFGEIGGKKVKTIINLESIPIRKMFTRTNKRGV